MSLTISPSKRKRRSKRVLMTFVRDTPSTTVPATRIKKLIAKAGKGAAESFREILVDVLSETAKKMLWPSE